MDTALDLPQELLPLDEYAPAGVDAPSVPIGRLDPAISKELAEKYSLGAMPSNFPKLLARYGASHDAATTLNAASGSNLVTQSVLTSLVIKMDNLMVDKASIMEMTPNLVDVTKVLIRVNTAQVQHRVSVARANTEDRMARDRPRSVDTASFKPGQIIEAENPESAKIVKAITGGEPECSVSKLD